MKHFLLFCMIPCIVFGTAHTTGKWNKLNYKSILSYDVHLEKAKDAIEGKHFNLARMHLSLIMDHGKKSGVLQDSYFFMGNLYYGLKDYDNANRYFSKYLAQPHNLQWIQEVFEKKYEIAMKFVQGEAKTRLFGSKKLPRVSKGRSLANEIFDEIIATLPSSELAAKAYLQKGDFLASKKEWQEALDQYQMLIHYCPFSELCFEAHIAIGDVYLKRLSDEDCNLDFFGFAKANKESFVTMFPSDDRVIQLDQYLAKMEEMYAQDLYTKARYYERKNKKESAKVYYSMILRKYPSTHVASRIRKEHPSI